MKLLDHSVIVVFIAGTYTPVTVLALRPGVGHHAPRARWSNAALGVLVTVLRLERWNRVGFAMNLVLGRLAIVAAAQLLRSVTSVELALLNIGGILHTVGAVVLAGKRPVPPAGGLWLPRGLAHVRRRCQGLS